MDLAAPKPGGPQPRLGARRHGGSMFIVPAGRGWLTVAPHTTGERPRLGAGGGQGKLMEASLHFRLRLWTLWRPMCFVFCRDHNGRR